MLQLKTSVRIAEATLVFRELMKQYNTYSRILITSNDQSLEIVKLRVIRQFI